MEPSPLAALLCRTHDVQLTCKNVATLPAWGSVPSALFGNCRLGGGRPSTATRDDRSLLLAPFTAKADAKAWLAAEETAIRGGRWVDPTAGRMKVNDLIDRRLVGVGRQQAGVLTRP